MEVGKKSMIFVILGSQKFQFNRLLEYMDQLIKDNELNQSVFAQTGFSDYVPENFDYKDFLSQEEFDYYIKKASLIITHSGTGSIVNALKTNKKVIAVPRLEKYQEHVDNHQIEIAEIFSKKNNIKIALDKSQLKYELQNIKSFEPTIFKSNSNIFIKKLSDIINEKNDKDKVK